MFNFLVVQASTQPVAPPAPIMAPVMNPVQPMPEPHPQPQPQAPPTSQDPRTQAVSSTAQRKVEHEASIVIRCTM